MNFIETFEHYFERVPSKMVVTSIFNEIIRGKRMLASSNELIEYSFHYPVDTERYLEELMSKFEVAVKEELRTIEGSLKAYMQTFLYYCMGCSQGIPIRTSLLAAELYMKIVLLPSGVGKLYYEVNMYVMVLHILNRAIRKRSPQIDLVSSVINLSYDYISVREVPFVLIQGTSNLYANIVKYRATEGNIKDANDPLCLLCLKRLKDLIIIRNHPKELRFIIESMLRCLRNKMCKSITNEQRNISLSISKKFIKNTLLVEIEDKSKLQYFLDSLFSLFSTSDFDCFQDCVELINMLDEDLYKEFLQRIANYLISQNHDTCHLNLMYLIYYMFNNPHPGKFRKVDVLFTVCFKNIVIHLLDENKEAQDNTIKVMSKICLLEDCTMLDEIFQVVNSTGNLASLEPKSILLALIHILSDKYAGNSDRSKCVLHIVSRLLISLNKMDGTLAEQVLYLICREGTPFSIKEILPDLHDLFLQLSDKASSKAREAIMRIFYKLALHPDPSSSVFLEHLYNCVIFTSTVKGKTYGPEQYSNVLFSDEFDYELFLPKCRNSIKYDHVHQIISNFKCSEQGYYLLLHSMLNFVGYKEYDQLTDIIVDNFEEICTQESAGHLFDSYRKILLNKGVYHQMDLQKFDVIHSYAWDILFKQACSLPSIKCLFALIETLKQILHLPDDEHRKVALLTIVTECAYRSLKQHKFYMGSVMMLTELCIALRRPPRVEILSIFENVIHDNDAFELLQTTYKDTLIQLISFFGTLAMLNRTQVLPATFLLRKSLRVPDPLVQLTAIKTYFTLATEISREFDHIVKFCFAYVISPHSVLSRACITILEELIYENCILLDSENFMRFVHRLGSSSLRDFMVHVLKERFTISNKHDIGRFYIKTLVYMSGYSKLPNYAIARNFQENLTAMRHLIDCPNVLINFLFKSLQINTKFSILTELSAIFDSLVAGKCKIDDSFFVFFHYSLYTFKTMAGKPDFEYDQSFYEHLCYSVNEQIFQRDPNFQVLAFYGEYESDVKRCSVSLLELLFFINNEEQLNEYFCPVFDTVVCWIDHVKSELIQCIQHEKVKDFDHSLRRLVCLYKHNRARLGNFLNNQEDKSYGIM